MPRIIEVIAGSIADEGGVLPGDELISVNGVIINDFFDYRFHTSSDELELLFRGADGDEWILDVDNAGDEDLGLVFDNWLLDEPRSCANRCVFCFIDQLPRGMRAPLYFKDDDIRLTFTNGNYVTLTNVGDHELSRIVNYKLSPVNISVHSTDAALRARMLGYSGTGGHGEVQAIPDRYDILPKLIFLTESGITVNAQIVLCRGYNDGLALDATLGALGGLNGCLASVSVVPSGLTRFREGLPGLTAYDKGSAETVLCQVSAWQKIFLRQRGSRTVFAADEFYILGEKRLPGHASYEGYPQLENGVGMASLFMKQFRDKLAGLRRAKPPRGVYTRIAELPPSYIVTGYAASDMMNRCVTMIQNALPGLDVGVVPVENTFFGEKITVTGLLTGSDILKCLKTMDLNEKPRFFISKAMLKYDSEVFLDDISLEMLRNTLKVDIIAVENDGGALIRALLQA